MSTILFASQEGCNIFKQVNEQKAYKALPIVEEVVEETPKDLKQFIKITPDISSITTLYQEKEVLVKRHQKEDKTCPPFCIQPMNIEGVRTVGELETLSFIDKKNNNRLKLLLDVRENQDYQEATIPSAINLPLSMLDEKSPYYTKVLKLLGAKKVNDTWYFKNAHTLLVFGQSFMSNEAVVMIQRLQALNYPNDKILYYRSGMEGWIMSGLTTY